MPLLLTRPVSPSRYSTSRLLIAAVAPDEEEGEDSGDRPPQIAV
jgi:hypothetical protein